MQFYRGRLTCPQGTAQPTREGLLATPTFIRIALALPPPTGHLGTSSVQPVPTQTGQGGPEMREAPPLLLGTLSSSLHRKGWHQHFLPPGTSGPAGQAAMQGAGGRAGEPNLCPPSPLLQTPALAQGRWGKPLPQENSTNKAGRARPRGGLHGNRWPSLLTGPEGQTRRKLGPEEVYWSPPAPEPPLPLLPCTPPSHQLLSPLPTSSSQSLTAIGTGSPGFPPPPTSPIRQTSASWLQNEF